MSSDPRYAMGGLMRCCIATLEEAEDLPTGDGSVWPCRWCSGSMTLDGDVWRWTNPATAAGSLEETP